MISIMIIIIIIIVIIIIIRVLFVSMSGHVEENDVEVTHHYGVHLLSFLM